jgi:hypothetical protein
MLSRIPVPEAPEIQALRSFESVLRWSGNRFVGNDTGNGDRRLAVLADLT